MKQLLALAISIAAGCGPLVVPMGIRLPPEEQRRVDSMWDNMLTPTDRCDRDTLLDVVVLDQLHSAGVDRLEMTSRKKLTDGRVVYMCVEYCRSEPSRDEFELTIKNSWGWTLRRERYSGSEVLSRLADLGALGKTDA